MKEQSDACPLPPGSVEEKTILDTIFTGLMNFCRSWKNVLPVIIFASAVLVYLVSSSPGTLAAAIAKTSEYIWVTDDYPSWNRSLSDDMFEGVEGYLYSDVETVDDLIISGDQVYVIENCTKILQGYILVKDNAQLVIRNAEIYNIKHGVRGGELVPYYANIYLQDSSSLHLDNASIRGERDIALTLNNSTKAAINHSLIRGRLIIFGDARTELHDSKLDDLQVAQKAQINIRDSSISSLMYREEEPLVGDHKAPVIWETDFDEVKVEAWNTYFELVMLPIRGCSNFNHTGRITWGTEWSLKELYPDSEVLEFKAHESTYKYITFIIMDSTASFENVPDLGEIHAHNSDLYLKNSKLRALAIISGTGTIDDSIITLTILEDGAQTRFKQTQVGTLALINYSGEAFFNNSYVDRLFIDGEMNGTIEGSILFGDEALNAYSTNEEVTVSYTLVTQTPEYVIPGAVVQLFDLDGEEMWSKTTDENGTVSFQITYKPGDIDTKYLLQSSIRDHVCRSYVDITTSEYPIIHEFEKLPRQEGLMVTVVKALSVIVILGTLLLKKISTT